MDNIPDISTVYSGKTDMISDSAAILDIAVSFDWYWMTKGPQQSHVGVGFVINCETRFFIDFEVLSNKCDLCVLKKNHCHHLIFILGKITHIKLVPRTLMVSPVPWKQM